MFLLSTGCPIGQEFVFRLTSIFIFLSMLNLMGIVLIKGTDTDDKISFLMSPRPVAALILQLAF